MAMTHDSWVLYWPHVKATPRRAFSHCFQIQRVSPSLWNQYEKEQMTGTRGSMGCQQWSYSNANNHPVSICENGVGIKLPCSDSLKKRSFTKSKRCAKPRYNVLYHGGVILGLGYVGTISWRRRLGHLEGSIHSRNTLSSEQPWHTEISSWKKISSQCNSGKVFIAFPSSITALPPPSPLQEGLKKRVQIKATF